jgi:Holliday junction resolvase RusA-like endonuclease
VSVIEVCIPGEIRGKGRPRFGKGFAHTPERTRNAEAWVRSCAAQAWPAAPLDGPLSITLDIGVPVPRSWAKKRQADALAGAIFPTARPDLDNQLKLIGDACNGILWRDDAQIVRAVVSRRYAETPAAVLKVFEA